MSTTENHRLCPNCSGTGKTICTLCEGSTHDKCPECKGTGRSSFHSCSSCGGIGYSNESCFLCDGSGLTECDICRGSGKLQNKYYKKFWVRKFLRYCATVILLFTILGHIYAILAK